VDERFPRSMSDQGRDPENSHDSIQGPLLTDDEFAVLHWFDENQWDTESLAGLRPLAREPHARRVNPERLARLRAAVEGLLQHGLVEVRQTRDFNPNEPQTLAPLEAARVLREDDAWAVVGQSNFDPNRDFYIVAPNQTAIEVHRRTLREPGRKRPPFGRLD
jgi:hypothetical protein